jgi:hypothetical protein
LTETGHSACFGRMWLTRRTVVQVPSCLAFAGFRFPPEVIVLAVRWYLRSVCCISRAERRPDFR